MKDKMRYKLAGIVLVFLVATPLYGQPIAVDTYPLVPTLVKTGEVFRATYRIRYLDLSRWNEEIVLFDEELDREGFQGQVGSLFEVMSVEHVEYGGLINQDGEYWHDFIVALRIIDKEKGVKKIPKLKFGWTIKSAGQTDEELQASVVESLEIFVNYFSTIAPDPYLDVRDVPKFEDVLLQARIFRFAIPGAALLFLAFWAFLAVRFIRTPRRAAIASSITEALDSSKIEDYIFGRETMTFRRARKFLAEAIKRNKKILLAGRDGSGSWKLLEVTKDIHAAVRSFLAAALPSLNPGDMPGDMERFIDSNVRDGLVKEVYKELALMLGFYQTDLEKADPSTIGMDPIAHIIFLESVVKRLSLFNRRRAGFVSACRRYQAMIAGFLKKLRVFKR